MITIWKYKLKAMDVQKIPMPIGAKIRSFDTQYGEPGLWAMVDSKEERMLDRSIAIVGTGHEVVYDNWRFIGTVKIEAETLIFHVFEEV